MSSEKNWCVVSATVYPEGVQWGRGQGLGHFYINLGKPCPGFVHRGAAKLEEVCSGDVPGSRMFHPIFPISDLCALTYLLIFKRDILKDI